MKLSLLPWPNAAFWKPGSGLQGWKTVAVLSVVLITGTKRSVIQIEIGTLMLQENIRDPTDWVKCCFSPQISEPFSPAAAERSFSWLSLKQEVFQANASLWLFDFAPAGGPPQVTMLSKYKALISSKPAVGKLYLPAAAYWHSYWALKQT